MKSSSLVVASTLLAVGLASATGAWAKPDSKSTHPPTNHGQTVSEVARAKSTTSTTTSSTTSNNRYKTKVKVKTKTKTIPHTAATRSTKMNNATHIRNVAIQAVQRTYQQRRAQILNDGNNGDNLTSAQRQALAAALHNRNLAIRQAQEQYRLTVRRIG